MAKILYICGLGHSGSTLLDLLLGNHPRIVSMGEVDSAIRRRRDAMPTCTCGSAARECPVWGPAFAAVDALHPRTPYADKYAEVVAAVEAEYGSDILISDSSKGLGTLGKLVRSNRFDVVPLHLIKDVRSYTHSQMVRRRLDPFSDRLRRPLRGTAAYNVWRWWSENRRIERRMERLRLDALPVSYEELCFRPEATLRRICDHAGLAFDEAMLTPRGGASHIVRGNHMRSDPDKLMGIRYDYRWLRAGVAVSFFSIPALRYNAQAAYRGRVWGSDSEG